MTYKLICPTPGEVIRPNQTGGWYHVETDAHRSDQRCFLYATRAEIGPLDEYRGQ